MYFSLQFHQSMLKLIETQRTNFPLSSLHRLPTMAVWGTTGGVALVYVTDWRLVLDYVPYINGKFKNDD